MLLGRGFRGGVDLTAEVAEKPDGSRAITAKGSAKGLGIGNPKVDAVLAGTTTLDLAATQKTDGSFVVGRLRAGNSQFSIAGDGSPTTGLNIDAKLNNLELLVLGFPGPAEIKGTVHNTGPNYEEPVRHRPRRQQGARHRQHCDQPCLGQSSGLGQRQCRRGEPVPSAPAASRGRSASICG